MKAIAVFAAVAALTLPGLAAAAAVPDRAREPQDRAEIAELMWRYTRALDTLNGEAYAAAFTADGAFGAFKGRAALVQMVAGIAKERAERDARLGPRGPSFHTETNEHLEFVDRDHVRSRYYWITFYAPAAGAPAGAAPTISSVGRGIDDLVRVGGKWLIKSRNIYPEAGQE
jgi:hypothetical protein